MPIRASANSIVALRDRLGSGPGAGSGLDRQSRLEAVATATLSLRCAAIWEEISTSQWKTAEIAGFDGGRMKRRRSHAWPVRLLVWLCLAILSLVLLLSAIWLAGAFYYQGPSSQPAFIALAAFQPVVLGTWTGRSARW